MVAAASITSSQARALALINYPTPDMRAAQARVIATVRQDSDIEVAQARVLVVGRGRFEVPRITAWTFTLDGHDFYVLKLPTETLVCDLSTNKWHVWGSGDDVIWRAHTGIQWQRPLALAATYGSNIVCGDDTYGMVYFFAPEAQVDEHPETDRVDIPFQRAIIGQIALRGRDAVPCWGVEVYGSIGEQITADYVSVQLYTSDDQGHTYDDHGALDINMGDYSARLEWLSLGQMQAPGRLVKVVDYGALVRIDGLEVPDAKSK